MKKLGIALIVIGLIMTVITGFNLVTTKKVVDLGPIDIKKEQSHPVQWSPIVGGILLVGGIIIVIAGGNK